jgi:RNA-binding protein
MLSERQKKELRRLGHPLKPLVTLGAAGLTDTVVSELEQTIRDHELVKIRVRSASREQRDHDIAELARRTRATVVQRIGNVALLYRADAVMPRIVLPDA